MTTGLLTAADRLRIGMIAGCAAIFAFASPFTALRVDWSSLAPVFGMAALVAAIGLGYRLLGRDEGIAATTLIVAQVIVYANVAVLDNYLGLELRRPLVDSTLAQIDAAFGVNWWDYVSLVKSNSLFGRVLTIAYMSSLAQVAAVIVILGFTRRFERLDRFSLAFMVSSALMIAVWTLYPSFGALPLHYAQGMAEPPFPLAMSRDEALKLMALHAGPTPFLRMDDFLGLIGCPSFHTALAMLTIIALWGVPYVGKISLVLNVLVLASIPADGGHHFVDIAAGAALTALAVVLANAATRLVRAKQINQENLEPSLAMPS